MGTGLGGGAKSDGPGVRSIGFPNIFLGWVGGAVRGLCLLDGGVASVGISSGAERLKLGSFFGGAVVAEDVTTFEEDAGEVDESDKANDCLGLG